MSGHGAEEIRRHVRVYMMVFGALGVLTIVTVAVSYLHLPVGPAVALALVVALTKGSLVALFFMHLVSEEKAIYWLLGLTAAFFALLLYLPSGWYTNEIKLDPMWSVLPHEGAPAHDEHGHGAGHAEAAEGHAEEHH